MTFFSACLLFMSFAKNGETRTIASRAPAVAFAALEAFWAKGPVFEDDADGDKTIALLERVAYLESRGDAFAVNKAGGDAGLTQLRPYWWQGHTKSEILGNHRLAFELTIDAFRSLRSTCGGNAQRWLGGFAAGECGAAPITVRLRCAPLGLCESM